MFYDISEIKLKMIFDVLKNTNKLLSKKEIPHMLDTFFIQIIVPYETRNLNPHEIETIIENYKTIYDEMLKNNSITQLTKTDIQKILF